jgi:hypothetical protein
MYKQKNQDSNVPTSSSTLNPLFKKPILVNVRRGTVTFFIREEHSPSEQMMKVMKKHGVKLSS